LLPSAVLGVEAVDATLLPLASRFALLGSLLLLSALLLDRLIGLPLANPLVVVALLLMLGMLLRTRILLLRLLLCGWFLVLLLAPLLCGLGLSFRLFLLVALLLLLLLHKSGSSEKEYQNCCANRSKSLDGHLLGCSLDS
jgi:hypothetical protein